MKIPQLTTGNETTTLVLVPPGTEWKDVMEHRAEIRTVAGWTEDGGRTFNELERPRPVERSRIEVAYALPDERGNLTQGGALKDGVIEVRRGVEDLNMGNATYAQVRVLTDTGQFLKGMAVYSDDLPPGVDIRYNTSKPSGTPDEKVFKKLDNPDDPIQPWKADTSLKKQKIYTDADGNQQRSALNIVSEEGYWSEWGEGLSSQMLSK